MKPIALALSFALSSFAALPAAAQEWSGFRGHNGSAIAGAKGLPVSFGPAENMRWKAEVPFGQSSPVLTATAVVVTGSDAESLYVMAIDRASGEELWTQALVRAHAEEIYSANDSASPTPATDGENVYVFFPELGLVSFDAEGEERWVHPLGPFVNFYGMSSSPVLAGGAVILLCDQQQGSYLLAVDAETGDELWKVERPGMVECWTTPVGHPADAPEQVIVSGTFYVHGYSVKTGAELWSLKGFGYTPTPSPTLLGDMLYVCAPDHSEQPLPTFASLLADNDGNGDGKLSRAELSGPMRDHFGWVDSDKDGVIVEAEWTFARDGMASKDYGMVAIDLAAEGGPAELWRFKKGLPSISSPLVYDGILYLAKDSGLMTTLDAKSGDVLQRERLPDGMGECYPSPVAADGKIFVVNNAGRVAVLEAGADWNVLGSNDLGEECFATPAIGKDSLYVRTRNAVYRFGTTGP